LRAAESWRSASSTLRLTRATSTTLPPAEVRAAWRTAERVIPAASAAGRHWYPDAWDLPGGHVEAGEAPRHALERELSEELGIKTAVVGRRFAQVHGKTFRMDVWGVDRWTGEPANRDLDEHDALAWLNVQEMGALHLVACRL